MSAGAGTRPSVSSTGAQSSETAIRAHTSTSVRAHQDGATSTARFTNDEVIDLFSPPQSPGNMVNMESSIAEDDGLKIPLEEDIAKYTIEWAAFAGRVAMGLEDGVNASGKCSQQRKSEQRGWAML